MPKPGEQKTVQSRILKYAGDIGWTYVSQSEAEKRRGFGEGATPAERSAGASLYFTDLLSDKVRELNPSYCHGPEDVVV